MTEGSDTDRNLATAEVKTKVRAEIILLISVHVRIARVTVVGFSVCPLVANSLQERLFVLKTLSRTQRATKVKRFVGFSLKPLRCRDPAPPPLYGHAYSRPFFHVYFSCTRMRISRVYTRMIHRRGFSTFVLFIAVYFVNVNLMLLQYCMCF